MKLSDGEKLILLMLSELYAKLEIKGEVDATLIKSAIFTDNAWGLKWKYHNIPFEDDKNPAIVDEVVNTLEMWDLIERSYISLPEPGKSRVARDAAPYGKDPKFPGYNADNEKEYSIIRFLINDLGRFQAFAGRNLDSNTPSAEAYRRMFQVFSPMQENLANNTNLLTAYQLIQVLNEMRTPDH